MKIAIHHRSGSFSDGWIAYCNSNSIEYKLVDGYSNSIINDLEDCYAFMWHFSNYNYRDMIVARHVLYTAEQMGKRVFPDFRTAWHFDDKIAQKYLLESIDAPLIPAYVFFDRNDALQFSRQCKYPIVAKLRRGAGSKGVRLIRSQREAAAWIAKSFSKGIPQLNFATILRERISKYRLGKESAKGVMKGFARLFIKSEYYRMSSNEKGYVYFQQFVPGCTYDIRLKVIDDKCWGFIRHVRRNDFRASGSGMLEHAIDKIPITTVAVAFEVAQKLNLQSVAYDFVLDDRGYPKLIELSYGFGMDGNLFYGFWNNRLKRIECAFDPYGWMVEMVVQRTSCESPVIK